MMKSVSLASALLLSWISISACAKVSNWRELLVPSFETDHGFAEGQWQAPGAASFKQVGVALEKIQARNNITEGLLSTLPGLPKVTTLYVNMSDGVQIWTRVVNPWPYTLKKPACFVRSPYGSKQTQNLALIFLVLNGHAAVMQETRGTWNSGGIFDMWRNSSTDARDTINWITSQSWNNGEVYSQGASADGIDALEITTVSPRQLHGEWLIWTTGDGHHFVYPGGAYRKDLMLGYMGSLKHATRGAATALVLPATQQNEGYGQWWHNLTDCKNISNPAMAPCDILKVKWPMVLNAAWWDLFEHTLLDAWFGLRKLSDPSVRNDHVLIVGPLGHNIAGKLDTGKVESAQLYAAEIDALVVGGELVSEFWRWSKCSDESNMCKCKGRARFGKLDIWSQGKFVNGSIACDTEHFDDPLPGVTKECQCQQATGKLRERIGRVNLFVMGNFAADIPIFAGNYWTSLDDFPRPTAKQLYLMAGAKLGDSPPSEPGSISYQYDPRDPAPMIGGNNLPAIGTIEFSGSANQLPRENRSDVEFFDSAPLTEDLAIVGHVSAEMFVSSSAEDTDFFVTVSDLSSDASKSMLVRCGMQRMRWRDSEETKSVPMRPDKVYVANVNMGYTAYIFPKGHRIRVSISSAANPYYNPTSNTGANDMTTKAEPVVAKNTVHFAPQLPSRLILPVVSLKDIPENPHFSPVSPSVASSTQNVVI